MSVIGKAINELENRYGKLLVIKKSLPTDTSTAAFWLCKCDCGKEVIVRGQNLRNGSTQSCGCYREEIRLNIISLPEGEASFNQLYRNYAVAAKKRNRLFSLSKEQFKYLVEQNCYYCGKHPQNICSTLNDTGDFIYNGIDRLDNSQGYLLNNCVACCEECNRAKLTKTEEEFKTWIIRIYKHYIEGENHEYSFNL